MATSFDIPGSVIIDGQIERIPPDICRTITQLNGFLINLQSVDYDYDNSTSTWEYVISGLYTGPEMDFWVIKLDTGDIPLKFLESSHHYTILTEDSEIGVSGVQFNQKISSQESCVFSFTIPYTPKISRTPIAISLSGEIHNGWVCGPGDQLSKVSMETDEYETQQEEVMHDEIIDNGPTLDEADEYETQQEEVMHDEIIDNGPTLDEAVENELIEEEPVEHSYLANGAKDNTVEDTPTDEVTLEQEDEPNDVITDEIIEPAKGIKNGRENPLIEDKPSENTSETVAISADEVDSANEASEADEAEEANETNVEKVNKDTLIKDVSIKIIDEVKQMQGQEAKRPVHKIKLNKSESMAKVSKTEREAAMLELIKARTRKEIALANLLEAQLRILENSQEYKGKNTQESTQELTILNLVEKTIGTTSPNSMNKQTENKESKKQANAKTQNCACIPPKATSNKSASKSCLYIQCPYYRQCHLKHKY